YLAGQLAATRGCVGRQLAEHLPRGGQAAQRREQLSGRDGARGEVEQQLSGVDVLALGRGRRRAGKQVAPQVWSDDLGRGPPQRRGRHVAPRGGEEALAARIEEQTAQDGAERLGEHVGAEVGG